MDGDWIEAKLSALCESIDYGYTASASFVVSTPKFLRITDIVGTSLKWSAVPGTEVPPAQFDKYELHDGDIVVARTGATTGESMYIADPPSAIFASYLVRLKIKPAYSARFIAYWMKSEKYREYISGVLGDKSAQPNASAQTLTRAVVKLPASVHQQHRIARVLSSLDEKIAINREMSENLEQIARTLFQSWFVDFDPVRRAAAGEDTGLPPQIAALFPARFTDDGLPEGWTIKRADELGDLIRDGVEPSEVNPATPYVGLEHLARKQLTLETWGSAANVQSVKCRFTEGDLLFGKLRPYFHKVCIAPFKGICSSDIFVFRAKELAHKEFMYLAFSGDDFVSASANGSTGTRMPRADWRHLEAVLTFEQLVP